MTNRIAYMPLNTYPEAAPDPAVLAAIGFAAVLEGGLHVSTFAVDIPPVVAPLANLLINIEGMARAVEDRSRADCDHLRSLVEGAAEPKLNVQVAESQAGAGRSTGRRRDRGALLRFGASAVVRRSPFDTGYGTIACVRLWPAGDPSAAKDQSGTR